jgi:hypothetical protein
MEHRVPHSQINICTIPPVNSSSQPERRKTERGRKSPGLALVARANTDIFLERELLCTSLLLFPGKKVRQGKCSFPYYGIFSAI